MSGCSPQPVSAPLQDGIRFFQPLTPALPTVCLAVSPAPMFRGGNTGFPRSTFPTIQVGDLGPFCTPAALCPRRGTVTSPDRLHTFWSKPVSLIWLAPLDGASERSLVLTISPGTLALTQVEASRRAVTSRLPPLPPKRDSVHCREGFAPAWMHHDSTPP